MSASIVLVSGWTTSHLALTVSLYKQMDVLCLLRKTSVVSLTRRSRSCVGSKSLMQRQRHDKKAAIHYKEMLSHCASMMVLRNKDNLPGMVKACKWVQIFLVKFQIQLCFLPRTVCNRTWKISQRGSRLLEQLAVWLSRRPKQFRGLFNRLKVQPRDRYQPRGRQQFKVQRNRQRPHLCRSSKQLLHLRHLRRFSPQQIRL